ncbi:MAG TPA: regulatory protein RecX [Streptosporangiaceae bacterium]
MTSSRARRRTAGDHDDEQGGDPEAAALEICLRLLTAAPRTRAQLDQALRRRGMTQSAADAALDRLAGAGLIDDAAFARAWVDTRHRGRGLARRALTAELRQRGVDEGDVRAAVADLGPEQEAASARRLVEAKLAATRGRPLATRMRRLTGLLARKGYPPGMAYRVIREALEQEGIDPAQAGLEVEGVLDADAAAGEPDLDGELAVDPGD